MRVTSLLAFQEIIPTLENRELEVFKAIRQLQPCNNLMISEFLHLPVNCITGRVFSLRKYNLVIYYKKDICPYTKKLTYFWKIPNYISEVMVIQ